MFTLRNAMVPVPGTGLGQLLEIEGRTDPTKRVASIP
jgi:hypothetical protein